MGVWAILCSSVSLLLCMGIVKAYKQLEPHFNYVVFGMYVWWTLGVCILTFHGPYVRTGNAYFAAWCAWCACVWMLLEQFPQLKGFRDSGAGVGEGAAEEAEDKEACLPPSTFG